MKTVSTRLLLALGLALLAACSPSPSPSSHNGSARFVVSTRQTLTATGISDISRVTLTASAPDMAPRTVELTRSNDVWGGIIGDIPAGSERTFQARAFDYSGSLRYEGSASGITIDVEQSTLVAITLQEVGAPPPYANEAPIIDSLAVSSSSVLAGGSVSLAATAHDPNASDYLSYSWSGTGGYFNSSYGSSTTWQAPSSSGTYVLTLSVLDSAGTSSSISVEVSVRGGGEGRAEISISFNGTPGVSAMSASLSPVEVGQTTTVSATATDLDGDSLSYSWSASCEGSWESSWTSTARFTPTAQPSGTCNNCNLTVTILDGRGGRTTGKVALCVNAPSADSHSAPHITQSYRSSDTASANQVLTYSVVASDPDDSALGFSWEANVGTLGTATSGTSDSRVTWTAPLCVGAGLSPTITATVTNAFGLTATRSFQVNGLSACAPGTWVPTGTMGTAREYATATLLPDGRVLTVGGYFYSYWSSSYTYHATAEVYDPATGTWSATGSMAVSRYQHTATPLPNGKVLVTGGISSSASVATAELYDPATGTWSATSSMSTTRYQHTATLLANGKVLVTGGYGGYYSGGLATAELYDPATGTWSATGTMATGRYQHTATLLANGQVLVTGGSGGYYSGLSSAEVYDPSTGRWSTTGTMSASRGYHSATLLSDGRVLVAGGSGYYDNIATAEVYDPTTGTWHATGSMLSPRSGQTSTRLSNGTVLVVGGSSYYANQTTAEVYDPATGTWSAAETMTEPRSHQTATLLADGDVLIAGGYSYWDGSLTVAELFTP